MYAAIDKRPYPLESQLASFIDIIKEKLGRKKADHIDAAEFTEEFLAILREHISQIEVTIFSELHLNVMYNDQLSSVYLNKVYEEYVEQPERKAEIFETLLASLKDKFSTAMYRFNLKQIFPLLKTKDWLAQHDDRTNEKTILIHDSFNDDIVIVYAEKMPGSGGKLVYLNVQGFNAVDIARASLRQQAVQNLINLIGKIEIHQGPGVHMLSAGGNYESSLWLVDALLNRENLPPIEGDLVVAAPAADTLLITGSRETIGLIKAKEIIETVKAQNTDLLSTKMFSRKEKSWQEFFP